MKSVRYKEELAEETLTTSSVSNYELPFSYNLRLRSNPKKKNQIKKYCNFFMMCSTIKNYLFEGHLKAVVCIFTAAVDCGAIRK